MSHINHGSILEVWPKLVGGVRAKDKTTGRGEEATSSSDSDDDAQVRASEHSMKSQIYGCVKTS